MNNVDFWIERLRLEPHPEGGFYREYYRASARLPGTAPADAAGRSLCTAIYYLLERGRSSAFHRIRSDEIWHFHSGGPLLFYSVAPDGSFSSATLGADPTAGHALNIVAPAGHWIAAEPSPESLFSLVSCTASPGFEFRDLDMADPEQLISTCPAREALIRKLTLQH